MDDALNYSNYLHLDKILGSQHPKSFEAPNEPAHDEMLFIIIHQSYELWFWQILFELDYVSGVFQKEKINDNSEDLNLVRHRLQRIIRIIELLNNQISILDTMTPLDFMEFRNLLTPASGFQSLQFRMIEAQLGLQLQNRHQHDYYKRTNQGGFSAADFATISSFEKGHTIPELVNKWLERMPFFDEQYWAGCLKTTQQNIHPFWSAYRTIYSESLTEKEKDKLIDFDYVFFEQPSGAHTEEYRQNLRVQLSPAAMKAALFIMLYRDFPVFQTSYQVLDALVEIDLMLGNWRHKHIIMVKRMIGLRVGTGNTSGSGYLEGALNRHYVFRDLAALSTYLIPRNKLPLLPTELIEQLRFALQHN